MLLPGLPGHHLLTGISVCFHIFEIITWAEHCDMLCGLAMSGRKALHRAQCQCNAICLLQGGVVAAFGLVRGSAQADMLQLSARNPLETDTLAQVQAVLACTSNKTFKLSMQASKCCLYAHASLPADVNQSKVHQVLQGLFASPKCSSV